MTKQTTFRTSVLGALVGLSLVGIGVFAGNDPSLYTGLTILVGSVGFGVAYKPRR